MPEGATPQTLERACRMIAACTLAGDASAEKLISILGPGWSAWQATPPGLLENAASAVWEAVSADPKAPNQLGRAHPALQSLLGAALLLARVPPVPAARAVALAGACRLLSLTAGPPERWTPELEKEEDALLERVAATCMAELGEAGGPGGEARGAVARQSAAQLVMSCAYLAQEEDDQARAPSTPPSVPQDAWPSPAGPLSDHGFAGLQRRLRAAQRGVLGCGIQVGARPDGWASGSWAQLPRGSTSAGQVRHVWLLPGAEAGSGRPAELLGATEGDHLKLGGLSRSASALRELDLPSGRADLPWACARLPAGRVPWGLRRGLEQLASWAQLLGTILSICFAVAVATWLLLDRPGSTTAKIAGGLRWAMPLVLICHGYALGVQHLMPRFWRTRTLRAMAVAAPALLWIEERQGKQGGGSAAERGEPGVFPDSDWV